MVQGNSPDANFVIDESLLKPIFGPDVGYYVVDPLAWAHLPLLGECTQIDASSLLVRSGREHCLISLPKVELPRLRIKTAHSIITSSLKVASLSCGGTPVIPVNASISHSLSCKSIVGGLCSVGPRTLASHANLVGDRERANFDWPGEIRFSEYASLVAAGAKLIGSDKGELLCQKLSAREVFCKTRYVSWPDGGLPEVFPRGERIPTIEAYNQIRKEFEIENILQPLCEAIGLNVNRLLRIIETRIELFGQTRGKGLRM
jgi:hypothetical protein